MKNKSLLSVALWVTFVAPVAGICIWVFSYFIMVEAVWAEGTEHNWVLSHNGTLYLVQNHNWWRQEELKIIYDLHPVDSDLVTWPGMRINSHSEFLGFERVRGKWTSPFTLVRADTVFTSPDKVVKAGTMLMTTTPMDVYGVPYWCGVLILSLLSFTIAFVRHRLRARTRNAPILATDEIPATA